MEGEERGVDPARAAHLLFHDGLDGERHDRRDVARHDDGTGARVVERQHRCREHRREELRNPHRPSAHIGPVAHAQRPPEQGDDDEVGERHLDESDRDWQVPHDHDGLVDQQHAALAHHQEGHREDEPGVVLDLQYVASRAIVRRMGCEDGLIAPGGERAGWGAAAGAGA